MTAEHDLLLQMLDDAYDHHAWHGTNLRGALRGVTAEEAQWRPANGRHNIWELALHCAYWKYTVRRRITGEKRMSFARKGSDWFPLPDEPSERAWREDLALLESEHRALRALISKLTPEQLHEKRHRRYTNMQMLYGVASHDLYHCGQIQLLKRLEGV